MTDAAADSAEDQIRQLTECSICMNGFTDPRMLPCIHTFCFECIRRTAETAQKKPGDNIPCPLCRKEFTIPREGIDDLQKNFFMENLLEFKTTMQRNDSISKNESETKDEIRQITNVKYCGKHSQKPLDYHCIDCKKIVCVSCFVESHKLHDCRDITKVGEEFRQLIEKYAWKISHNAEEVISLKKSLELRKVDFLKTIVDNENAIIQRNQELKVMIDGHTESLLDELSTLKSNHLKKIESEMEEIERCRTILQSFYAYCTEIALKGSASDICSSFNQIAVRADDLEQDHKTFIGRPIQSVEVSFQLKDSEASLQNASSDVERKVEAFTKSMLGIRKHFEKAKNGVDDSHLPEKKELCEKIKLTKRLLSKTRAERDGLLKMQDAYKKDARFGDPHSLNKSLKEVTKKLHRLKQELNEYEDMLAKEETRNLQPESLSRSNSELSISSANQRQKNQSSLVTASPNCSDVTRSNNYSGEEHCHNRMSSGAEEHTLEAYKDDGIAVSLGMCTAIYPFEATNVEAISMSAGERFKIIDIDIGSGWTRVIRSDGETGFVPTSYLDCKCN